MTLVLNTLIFENDWKKGAKQADLVDRVAKLGADGVEVRREYFRDINKELSEVAERAKKNNLLVNYSVPDVIFEDDGSVNPKMQQYFDEGKILGLKKIKFNVGHFDKFTGDLRSELGKLPLDQIQLNIENDQTSVSGNAKSIETFLAAARKVGLTSLGYVYDLGNWAFTNGNAEVAARELTPYTHYIHLKNVIDDNGKLITSDDLNKGMFDWKKLIKILPIDQSYALEFPMKDDEQVLSQMKLLNNEVGA